MDNKKDSVLEVLEVEKKLVNLQTTNTTNHVNGNDKDNDSVVVDDEEDDDQVNGKTDSNVENSQEEGEYDNDNDNDNDKSKKKNKNRKKKKKKNKGKKNGNLTGGMTENQLQQFYQSAIDKFAEQTSLEKVSKILQDRYKGHLKFEVKDDESLKRALLTPDPRFIKYVGFTGPLRPAFVTPQLSVPDHIEKPDYGSHPQGISLSEREEKRESRIHVHTDEEIQKIRYACKIGREVLDIAGHYVKTGATGEEIDRIVFQACIERNAYPSPLNYYRFPKSFCVSPNEVICHGIPDCRPFESGDIINLDISVFVDGVHADLNETYLVGDVDEDSVNLVRTAYESLARAAEMIKPGTMYRDLGATITKTAAQNGCCVNRTYCGHGVGLYFHCAPNVPHYAKNKAVGIMRPGHIFTIEPMINQGSKWGDILWPDDWTVTTIDGKRSAQFEHTFLVTETGCEILTARPGAPIDHMVWDEQYLRRP